MLCWQDCSAAGGRRSISTKKLSGSGGLASPRPLSGCSRSPQRCTRAFVGAERLILECLHILGDVAAYENIDAFRLAIEKAPRSRERLIDQTFVLSGIVQRKYMLLRRGLRFLLLAILACTAAVMINIPLGR